MADRISTLVLFEKPDAGEIGAVGLGVPAMRARSERRQGSISCPAGLVVTWAYGHMLELPPPATYLADVPAAKTVAADRSALEYLHWRSADALAQFTDAVFGRRLVAKPRTEANARRQFGVLKDLVKRADSIIIATDDDDEGEAIGWDLVEHLQFKGPVQRAVFVAVDPKSIATAVRNPVAGDKTRPRALAARARAEADWKIGMLLSAAAQQTFVPSAMRGITFRVGRVKCVVQWLVARRHREIRDFRPQKFFTVQMMIAAGGATAGAILVEHAPSGDLRIFNAELAEKVRHAAANWEGHARISRTEKRRPPPKLFSGSALVAAITRRSRVSLAQAETARNNCYSPLGILTYPRSSGTCLAESAIEHVPQVLAALKDVEGLARLVPSGLPVIRRGKGQTFSDADLAKASHDAIVPNPKSAGNYAERLREAGPLERDVFREAAERYLLQFWPDQVYDEILIEVPIIVDGIERVFRARTELIKDAGWTAAASSLVGDDDQMEQDVGDRQAQLAGFAAAGGHAHATSATIKEGKTEPPKPYTAATLIEAMSSVHRELQATDPRSARVLAEVGGIGTQASQPGLVTELIETHMISSDKKGRIDITTVGLTQVEAFEQHAPELVDPVLSAVIELEARAVRTGKQTIDGYVGKVESWINKIRTRFAAAPMLDPSAFGPEAAAAAATAGQVTIDQRKTAESVSRAIGLPIPDTALASRADLGAWIDEHMSRAREIWAAAAPSEKQIAYAKSLAAAAGVTLPDEALTSAQVLSSEIAKLAPKASGSGAKRSGPSSGRGRRRG